MRSESRHDHFPYARFLSARKCFGASFAPDGGRVAFVADISGVPEVWTLPTRGGWPDQISFFGDRVGFVEYAPDRDELVVGTDLGGNENVELWLMDGHGARLRPLTHDRAAMHPFAGWSPDGRSIAYSTNERNRAHLDLAVLDVASNAAKLVRETEGMWYVEGWSPDGRRLLATRSDSSSNNDLFMVDLASGDTVPLTPHDGSAVYLDPTFRPDGRAIYLITDENRDFRSLVELDLASGRRVPLVEADWDVEGFGLAPDGSTIAVALNRDGYSRLFLHDRATGAQRPIEVPPNVLVRTALGRAGNTFSWSADGRRIAFSLTSPRETTNVWLADPATAQAWPLTHATVGAIPAEAMVEPDLVRYPTFDGRAIPAFLYRPTASARSGAGPAVVYIHGGPEAQARPIYDPTIQFLVNQGYVVLQPNVRGSTGYGKAYSHLDDVEKRMDAVADAKAGADWLATEGHASARRIAAMGGSYGGFMVLAALSAYPDTWAAGVELYGVANFVTLLQNTHPFRRKHREAEYGSLERDRAVLEQISPLTHLDRVAAPLFVAHGENDIRVPISETEHVVAALRSRGVPVELVRFPNEGHGFVRLENRLAVYPAIADFLGRFV